MIIIATGHRGPTTDILVLIVNTTHTSDTVLITTTAQVAITGITEIMITTMPIPAVNITTTDTDVTRGPATVRPPRNVVMAMTLTATMAVTNVNVTSATKLGSRSCVRNETPSAMKSNGSTNALPTWRQRPERLIVKTNNHRGVVPKRSPCSWSRPPFGPRSRDPFDLAWDIVRDTNRTSGDPIHV